jgi:hypothetical protein
MGVYAFRSGPTYRAASPTEQFNAAFDMPLSVSSTLGEQFKGGILDSLGLGTTIREVQLPDEAPTEPTVTMQGPDGQPITLPDTPQMRRRATVQGIDLQPETPEQFAQRRRDAGALNEDQFKASQYFREGVKWDMGMTEDRAAALAEAYDAKKVREYFASKRPFTAFVGNLAGQAIDPINYIPIAGYAVKAANVARFGRIGGGLVTGALDAAANTALASAATFDARKSMGDDITWQSTVTDIAMAGLIGSAFGTVGGVVDARRSVKLDGARKAAEARLSTLKNVQEARVALNGAIDGLARGDDVALPANGAEAVLNVAENHASKIDRVTGVVRSRSVPADLAPVEAYHGTLSDFQKFDPQFLGRETNVGSARQAFFFSSDPRVSEGYAQPFNPYKEGIAGRLLPGKIGTVYQALNERFLKLLGHGGLVEEGRILRTRIRLENPMVIDRMGKEVVDSELEEALIKARAEGHDGVIFKNSRDPGYTDESDIPSDVYAVFDPDKIDILSRHDSAANASAYRGRMSAPPNLSTAKPEPKPIGRVEAEARIAKPETTKETAEQHKVNAEDGSFIEQAEIGQIRTEGRLTAEDEAALAEAQQTFDNGVAYGEALKAVAGCFI